jgi:hypothetical protein
MNTGPTAARARRASASLKSTDENNKGRREAAFSFAMIAGVQRTLSRTLFNGELSLLKSSGRFFLFYRYPVLKYHKQSLKDF